jgi:uncharacterized membrane protein YeaQ/YmgE (transglycosylase-associated protein family)
MSPEILANTLSWLVVGALTGWVAAPLMRFQGRMVLFSIVVGMAGSLLGGASITALKEFTAGRTTGTLPGALLFAFACAAMLLTTIPASLYGPPRAPQA